MTNANRTRSLRESAASRPLYGLYTDAHVPRTATIVRRLDCRYAGSRPLSPETWDDDGLTMTAVRRGTTLAALITQCLRPIITVSM